MGQIIGDVKCKNVSSIWDMAWMDLPVMPQLMRVEVTVVLSWHGRRTVWSEA